MQSHLNDGDEVIQIACNSELTGCDINHDANILKCMDCIAKRTNGLKAINGIVEQRSLSEFLTTEDTEMIEGLNFNFNSLEELQGIKYENFLVGYAVGSSMLLHTKNTTFDINNYRELTHSFIKNGIATYLAFKKILDIEKPNRVYNFNGRFTLNRAVFKACLNKKIDCYNHERGHDIFHYELYKNHLPQDREQFQLKVNSAWEKNYTLEKLKLGEAFYVDRAQGKAQSWYSFTNLQANDTLPESWDSTMQNIVIYSSSEFELVSSGDLWKNRLYKNQIEGINRIIESLKSHPGIKLYIRLHPNLKNADIEETNRFLSLSQKGVEIILPDSPVDSYALLKNADKVITFGSSLGLEATFWRIPSILAGPSFYDMLDACYQPKTHEQLIEMILNPLVSKNQVGALKYGFYMNTFGIPFAFYKPEDFDHGVFKDLNVQEDKPDIFTSATKAIYALGAPIISDAIYNYYQHKKIFKEKI